MFLGDRLQTRIISDNDEFDMISSDSNSIPSVILDDEEKYIHLPAKSQQWKRMSLRHKSKADFINSQNFNKNAYINLVGGLDGDVNKRVMVTMQPHESLNHLSSHIGQLMQHYRMFQNLLGLRATELKVVARNGHPINEEDSFLSIRKLIRLNFRRKSSEESSSSDEEKYNEPVEKMLMDGDEFVFKVTSFDKWVTIIIHFSLEDDPDFTFTAKIEMRVAGYFQNSHLFQLLTKLVINIWNDNIEDLRQVKDFYTLRYLTFHNKVLTKEFVDQEKKEATNIIEIDSSNNRFMNVMKEIKKEIKSINIAKKNYLEVPIDANAKVDDTFGYDGSLIVNATF